MSYYDSLDNLKLIIGRDTIDDQKSDLLQLYLSRAENFVLDYCNQEEMKPSMYEIAEEIALFNYRNKGVENMKAESKGKLSESYRDDLPKEIYKRLNNHRRMRFE
ncbi:phage head-tail connector protein [Peribacillus sp. JNUCC 23]